MVALALAAATATSLRAHETTTTPEKGPSGLPIPRFVSLKSDRVNLRQGPGVEYPTAWVFQRAGLPLEVVREFESWRQVRDAEGTTGWVLATMLSGRRTALVLPWEAKSGESGAVVVTLHDRDNDKSSAVAGLEAGTLASIISCDGHWCRVSIDGYRGYIEQTKLWGAYKGEVVK
jgi:SH3-like domain-containing protein